VTVAAIVLAVAASAVAAAVVWSWLVEQSAVRHPPNPRYCREPRCLRVAGHPGAHVDDAGRHWP
jgi:hypothetical protein